MKRNAGGLVLASLFAVTFAQRSHTPLAALRLRQAELFREISVTEHGIGLLSADRDKGIRVPRPCLA